MKRIITLLAALQIALSAQSYNDHILKIEAHIIPKIILMDYTFETKLINKRIKIVILYNENEKYIAQKIAGLIAERYPEGIKNYPIEVQILPYTDIGSTPTKASLFYLMDSDPKSIQKAIQAARSTHTFLFSHDKANLALGAHISLLLGKKITPLLNLKALKEFDISVRPALLTISEIYQ